MRRLNSFGIRRHSVPRSFAARTPEAKARNLLDVGQNPTLVEQSLGCVQVFIRVFSVALRKSASEPTASPESSLSLLWDV